MPSFIVNSPVKSQGVIHPIGAGIDLDDAAAAPLLAAGRILTPDAAGYDAASEETRQAVERMHGSGWEQMREIEAKAAAEAIAKAEAEAQAKAKAEAEAQAKADALPKVVDRASQDSSGAEKSTNEGDAARQAADASAGSASTAAAGGAKAKPGKDTKKK